MTMGGFIINKTTPFFGLHTWKMASSVNSKWLMCNFIWQIWRPLKLDSWFIVTLFQFIMRQSLHYSFFSRFLFTTNINNFFVVPTNIWKVKMMGINFKNNNNINKKTKQNKTKTKNKGTSVSVLNLACAVKMKYHQ